ERDVVAIEVVVVARDIAVVTVDHGAGHPAERIPDRGPSAVFERGPFDLERRRRRAEEEAVGERASLRLGHGSGVFLELDGHVCPQYRSVRCAIQPLTAPAMMPLTSCFPAKMNSSRSGIVARMTPASTIE